MAEMTRQPEAPTDAELLRRYLDGQSEAFGELVERYQTSLYGFLVRFTGNRTLAEDVFQETFLQVHHSAAGFDLARPFRPWLYTVAANKARDALRKKNRRQAAPLDATLTNDTGTSYADLLPDELPGPEEISSNREARQAVHDMIAELPEHLREVLVMCYFNELPYKEIAEALSIPVGTVKSRMHAAVRAFAEKWSAYLAEEKR
jgi:RNA polymerase sigma-70 factor, ECF subfamily